MDKDAERSSNATTIIYSQLQAKNLLKKSQNPTIIQI